MILKDFVCSYCDSINEHMCEQEDDKGEYYCYKCGMETPHVSRCNGGVNSRWRFCDWYGWDSSGHVSIEGKAGAAHYNLDTGEKEPLPHMSGVNCDEIQTGIDRRKEKREKIAYKSKRKKGKTPLFFDGGK